MSAPVPIDWSVSLSHLVAYELRRLRAGRGQTQAQAAAELNVDRALISMWETCYRPMPEETAQHIDAVWKTSGLLERLVHHAKREPGSWLDLYIEQERTARAILTYQPNLVPGLLQVESYMYAQAREGLAPGANVDEIVADRLSRQSVLEREPTPPMYWVRLDETALLQGVGGPEVMREQMGRLLASQGNPSVNLQLLPARVGAHAGLTGGFVLLRTADGRELGFTESKLGGHIRYALAEIDELVVSFNRITAKCMNEADSYDRLREILEEYR